MGGGASQVEPSADRKGTVPASGMGGCRGWLKDFAARLHPLPDIVLGEGALSGQPPVGPDHSTDQRRLAVTRSSPGPFTGELRGHRTFPRHHLKSHLIQKRPNFIEHSRKETKSKTRL